MNTLVYHSFIYSSFGLGIGNYDVNVLTIAFSQHQSQLVWFNTKKGIERLNWDNILGFIFNLRKENSLLSLLPDSYHWYGLYIFISLSLSLFLSVCLFF